MKPKPKNSEADLGGRAAANLNEPMSRRSGVPTVPSEDRVRHWLLAGFMAVCIGRPLVPSEGVSWLGDGHSFTILLLILTVVYFLTVIQRRALQRPLQLIDGAVALLVTFCVASSLLGLAATKWHVSDALELAARRSAPRIAVNMVWEWIGLGLVFFLARQLIVTSREKRAVAALMIALAVVVAAFGIYQVQVALPEQRAAYAENPDETLRELGQWFPPGSPERDRFEARLASPEPLATFALTNSLAGYLVAWLVVALGIAWSMFASCRPSVSGVTLLRFVGLAAGLALIASCLLLTRSRSAYVALAAGILLLPLVAQVWRRTIPWKGLATAGVVLLLVGGAVVAFSGRDQGLLSEAGKSFDYRLEYWESTLEMIGAFPIFGVGPGEFQNYYTRFKLPQASEEIRDPHNFLLEVWATGGTLAFLTLVGLLAAFGLFVWELKQPTELPAASAPTESPDDVWLLMLGAAAGFPLAYLAGMPFGFSLPPLQLVLGFALGAFVIGVLWDWIASGELPPRLSALGVLVLAIHWLAAGGVAFPGVAGSFWLLMALTVNQPISVTTASESTTGRPRRRIVPTLALLVTLAALVAHYSTAFLPVLGCRAEMARAANLRLTDEVRFEALLNAVRADPLSSDPWQAAAQLSAQRLAENPGNGLWQHRLITATSSVAMLESQSSAAASACADWFREVYVTNPDLQLAEIIVGYRRAAAGLYPNSAVVQGDYALSLETAEKPEAAGRAAARALELDELTPHADKKLSEEMRKQLKQLVESGKKSASEKKIPSQGGQSATQTEDAADSKDDELPAGEKAPDPSSAAAGNPPPQS